MGLRARLSTFVWVCLAGAASVAVGPCSPNDPPTCPDGQSLNSAGACTSSTPTTITVSVAPTGQNFANSILMRGFGGSGFVIGPGPGFSGVNTQLPTQFAGLTIEQFYGVAVDSQDRIIAAGSALNEAGSQVTLVARFDQNGILDRTFNQVGYVLGNDSGPAGGAPSIVRAIAIDSSDRILAAGFGFTFLNSGWSPTTPGFPSLLTPTIGTIHGFLYRLSTDGSIDQSFGSSGQAGSLFTPFTTSSSDQTYFRSVAVDPVSGNIAVAGYVTDVAGAKASALVAEYNSSGQLNFNPSSGFGPLSGAATCSGSTHVGYVVGKPCTTVAPSGQFQTGATFEEFFAVAITGSRIYAAGMTGANTTTSYCTLVAIYNSATGALDTTFTPSGGSGTAGYDYRCWDTTGPNADLFRAIAIQQSTGDVIAGGVYEVHSTSNQYGLVASYPPTSGAAASLKLTGAISAAGLTTASNPTTFTDVVTGLYASAAGPIIASVQSADKVGTYGGVIQLKSTATALDGTFAPSSSYVLTTNNRSTGVTVPAPGYGVISPTGTFDSLAAVAVQSSGLIIAAGTTTSAPTGAALMSYRSPLLIRVAPTGVYVK